eukprot:1096293-Rhodomonas_salina.1
MSEPTRTWCSPRSKLSWSRTNRASFWGDPSVLENGQTNGESEDFGIRLCSGGREGKGYLVDSCAGVCPEVFSPSEGVSSVGNGVAAINGRR